MELDIVQIHEIIPHRYPFLLVDKIVDFVPGEWARGIKCVSANEAHFVGHFPGHPVMPGVLILEALAQTGAVAILSMPENRGKTALFGGVKFARFRRQVVPGDVLELYCGEMTFRDAAGFGTAVAKVNGKVAAQAELSFVVS
ncbi:MAG: 3-hydroxyacyl-[acyl-carrier-protein] dehydratase FabZ [Clostridium sp. SCN 57-10]|nr:MAG: 3-hydroxyacyl-[acyl-carrier-protein] dehydratase FabZ [Clostridium sp. SCN 57-10]